MVYGDEVTIEAEAREVTVYAEGGLPVQQSVAATREGSQIDVVMRLSELAFRRPRNEVDALKRCLQAADPSWLWRVPNRGEGLSVKCARSIVRHYRNVAVLPNVVDTMIAGSNGPVPGWQMTVAVVDMENMVIETSTASTAKPERQRNEKDLAYTQRCFQQQLAFLGRIERNAIMKIVPGEWQPQIKSEIERRERGKPLAERVPKLVAAFAALGLNERDIKVIIGCEPAAMSEAQYQDLLGRGAAVKEREATKEEAFPELSPAGKPVADQPVIISQLQADLKGAGVAQSVALETAKEMFAGDGSVFSTADKPRLEHLTREQAGRLVEKCREEAMKKMGEASNG